MSNTKHTGGPAFPHAIQEHWIDEKTGNLVKGDEKEVAGMSLRDYFAAKAMQAILSSANTRRDVDTEDVARDAYVMADDMLKAREQ